MHFVYAMLSEVVGDLQWVKFGKARNPASRLESIRGGGLRIADCWQMAMPNAWAQDFVEAALHVRFAAWHHQGEWFRMPAKEMPDVPEVMRETAVKVIGWRPANVVRLPPYDQDTAGTRHREMHAMRYRALEGRTRWALTGEVAAVVGNQPMEKVEVKYRRLRKSLNAKA